VAFGCPAIEAADAMTKRLKVRLIGREFVVCGLTSPSSCAENRVRVNAAVRAGADACGCLGESGWPPTIMARPPLVKSSLLLNSSFGIQFEGSEI